MINDNFKKIFSEDLDVFEAALKLNVKSLLKDLIPNPELHADVGLLVDNLFKTTRMGKDGIPFWGIGDPLVYHSKEKIKKALGLKSK